MNLISILFILFSLNLIKSQQNLRELCLLFKPNGAFNGIQIYREKYNLKLYKSGKEWDIKATDDSIEFMSDTLKSYERLNGQQINYQFSVQRMSYDDSCDVIIIIYFIIN